MTRVHTEDLCAVCQNTAIVAALTIALNGAMLYSGSPWIAGRRPISLFTSWTARRQTQRQRRWLPGGMSLGREVCPPEEPEPVKKKGWPNSSDKYLMTPSICMYLRKKHSKPRHAFMSEWVVLVIWDAVSWVGPSLSFLIVMVINPLALSAEQTEVAFEELGSHYHARTPDQHTNGIQARPGRQQAFPWPIVISSPCRRSPPLFFLKKFEVICQKFKKIQSAKKIDFVCVRIGELIKGAKKLPLSECGW